MSRRQPETRTMKASDVRQDFSSVVGRVYRGEEHVIVERSGIPVAAIVSARDLERLQAYDRRREADFTAIDQMREAFKDVSAEEIEREAARSLAEVRAEMRAERERALAKAR